MGCGASVPSSDTGQAGPSPTASPAPVAGGARDGPLTPKANVPAPVSPSPKATTSAPAVSSTAIPLPPTPTAAPAAATPAVDVPVHADFSRVLIHGIEKKPELNGQIGLVISYDGGADRRYTVKVLGTVVKLKEEKLSIVPDGYEAPVVASQSGTVAADQPGCQPRTTTGEQSLQSVDSTIAAVSGLVAADASATIKSVPSAASELASQEARRREEATQEAIKRMPQGEVTASGRLIPTYDWVQVPPIASLPPGMEVWMPVGGLKCARIPTTWRLQVVAEGQVDCYRCDVGEHTPVIDVIIGAAAAFGWEVHELELHGDSKPIDIQEEATVGSAGLFGRKLTARNQVT